MANETVRSFSSRQLRLRAKEIDAEHGTDFHNLCKIKLDDSVIANISNCLHSHNFLDLSDGLYFTIGLLQKYKLNDFGEDFVTYFVERIPELIGEDQNAQVRIYALQLFIWLRDNYKNHRETMLGFLVSDNLSQKKNALVNYETYCKQEEIAPLLCFEQNDYVTELSMRGALKYPLRDMALEKISKIIGKNFMVNKVREYNEKWKDDVSFYDWQPFLEWYRRKKKKSTFGK